MASSLLATKIQIPPKAAQVVHRSRLINSLEAELPRCKLVLVAAPAGYGKTTLLSQWAHTSQLPVAWLSLSEEENELERFLRCLYHAWELAQPDIRESSLGVMLEGRLVDAQAMLSALVQLVIDTPGQTVFVLDDYHLIDDPEIHSALSFLLDHLPQTAHMVLSTRADPPLPLPRYRARAELLELRTEDLMFWQDETQEFFKQWMDLDLSRAELETLQNQSEGWATGLRLFGLTYRQRSAKPVQPEMTGKHRFISDYLGQEVLSGLPEDLRRFLLHTSILDRLCGPLCDAVTREMNGQAALEKLERANLFLVPLDETRNWYRYHRLFADFLRGELSRRNPELITALHSRAARWHLERDLPEQAFNHALDAGDHELMALIFDRYANAKLLAGEFSILKRWLDILPKQWLSTYPVLDLARAGYLAYTGSFDACLRVVNEVEERLRTTASEDAPRQLARVKSVRCFMACMSNDLPQAESFAGQALRDLPQEDLGFRPGIYAALGDTYRQNGLWEEARQCYLKALDFTQAPAVRVLSAHVYGALADLDLQQGRLQNAASYWKKALAFIQDRENWGHLPLSVSGWIYIRIAELLYEWNELESTAEHLSHGLERAELSGDMRTLMAGYILSSRLNLSGGELEKATDLIEQARQLVEQAPFPEWIDKFERCQIELWLAENRLRAPVLWADEKLRSASQDRTESGVAQLSVARVLIVKGDRPSIERALTLLENLLKTSEDEGRVGIVIEALTLQALAEWRRGGWPSALTALERALRLAEPQGYLRLFVDLGLPMGRLLQEARSRDIMVDYVAKLLDTFGSELASPGAPVRALPEPLTPREQEILELLAAGLTNREIAGQFVISPETVKKHVSSIYGKLGISNRTEAAALARELGLLG